MTRQSASKALSRFTVIDITRVRSGPTAVRQLADWGADVIKIEAPESLEPDGSVGALRSSSDFQNLQRNKRSLTLNLKQAEGVAILKRLVEKADVLVENFRPRVKHRLGIDYDSLKQINPRLVYASISGFGQDGPYADLPGYDQIAQGMGGLMSVTGLPGQGPVRVGIPIADLTAGLFCAHGILVALLEREVSGEGQWIQTSLLQSQMFMLDFQAARWLMDKDVPKQAGNNHPTHIPTGVFETGDGPINIAVLGETMWERFCKAINTEELASDSDYATEKDRLENRDALNARINEILLPKDSATWIKIFNDAGVPCGKINTIDGAFADSQVRHLGLTQTVDTTCRGPLDFLVQPVRLSRTPSEITLRPPERGEHTEEILEQLGYSPEEVSDFATRNII
jgi:crotonobetainyl-CoA:carnitine CoA-transferase CaiB-like acyl-CoA transferase